MIKNISANITYNAFLAQEYSSVAIKKKPSN